MQIIPTSAPMPRLKRKIRKPMHTFAVRQKPYALTPFCAVPVLAGETLQNLLMQARVVTHPVKAPLTGWWHEQYWFYVKLSDLSPNGVEYQSMLVDPDYSLPAGAKDEAASVDYYHAGSAGAKTINWVKRATDLVATHFFRDGDEVAGDYMIGNYPAVQYNRESWMQSMSLDTIYRGDDINLDLNNNATITAHETEIALRRWQFERAQGLQQMTWEDYLAAQGVAVKEEQVGKPELLRMATNWQYPSNTVEPSTGVPSSAVSWGIQERADKDRFFKEPGVILGLSVVRPKLYLSKQTGSMLSFLNDAYAWLPAQLRQDVEHSVRKMTTTVGPLTGQSADYWIDVRDLFAYGDQFVNFALTATDAGLVALPEATGQRKYPTLAMVEALFGDPVGKSLVSTDGVATFAIASSVRDLTAVTPSVA